MRMLRMTVMVACTLGACALYAEAPSYEEFTPGATRTQVLDTIKRKYTRFPVEERVDQRYGIPALVVTMFRQDKRYEVVLEFNYKEILHHIQVNIHGMNGDEYDRMLAELKVKYGNPDDERVIEKPALTWNFERKKYTLEVYFWGDHAQLDYSFFPSR
jgi:hypothetical protein